jgi:hypothetical protein
MKAAETDVEIDTRQDRRDERLRKERGRMPVHKVKSPRSGERLVKLAVRRALTGSGQTAVAVTQAERAARAARLKRLTAPRGASEPGARPIRPSTR